MSYSFSIRAPSLVAAKEMVALELDKVVAAQPIHEADRVQAQAAADEFISLLKEPGEGEEVSVSVSGSVCRWSASDCFTNAGVSISAGILQITT